MGVLKIDDNYIVLEAIAAWTPRLEQYEDGCCIWLVSGAVVNVPYSVEEVTRMIEETLARLNDGAL